MLIAAVRGRSHVVLRLEDPTDVENEGGVALVSQAHDRIRTAYIFHMIDETKY